jgi:indolepyruvate ferredoxin oxidoreductase beta subunit
MTATVQAQRTVNVLAVGVGGQGIITLTNVLAEAAFRAGFDAKQSEIHGLSQRGGSVSGQVRWGAKVYTPIIMEGEADFLVALEELEALRNVHRLKPDGLTLVNDFSILPATVVTGAAAYPQDIDGQLAGYGRVCRVPATRIAQELGNVRMSNIVMLGALSRHLDLPDNIWLEVIRENCPPKYVEQNLRAFAKGREVLLP